MEVTESCFTPNMDGRNSIHHLHELKLEDHGFQSNQNVSDISSSDFSSWTAEDDLLLKNAVESGAVLEALSKGIVQFSRNFSVKELQDRWHALLYVPEVSETAASRMLEIEASQSNNPKQKQLNKLKGKQYFIFKKRPSSVRNHYYRMRKRVDADKVFTLENCIFSNESLATCLGDVNGCLEDYTLIDGKHPMTNGMGMTDLATSFRLAPSSVDIEDQTFNHMDMYLTSDEVNGIGSAFPPAATISNDCFTYTESNAYAMLSETDRGVGKDGMSSDKTNHIVHNVTQVNPEHDIMDSTSYLEAHGLTLDQIRTALNSDNEPGMESILEFNHSSEGCKDINQNLFGAEGTVQEASVQHLSDVNMLPNLGNAKWAEKETVLSGSLTAHPSTYGSGDGNIMPNNEEILDGNCHISEKHTESLKSKPSECLGIHDVEDEAQCVRTPLCVYKQSLDISQCQTDTISKCEPSTSYDSDNYETRLYVNEPMICMINEEQQEVPCNDEFSPIVSQQALPVSFPSSAHPFQGNQVHLFTGETNVKVEPASLEKQMESTNEMCLECIKDEELGRASIDLQSDKKEGFGRIAQTFGKNVHDSGVPSSIIPIVNNDLQQKNGVEKTVGLNRSTDKTGLFCTHEVMQTAVKNNDDALDSTRSVHNGVKLTSVQTKSKHGCQVESVDLGDVGLDYSQMIKTDDMTDNPFFLEDHFSVSDEEMPPFSDVEDMVLGMDLTEEEEPFFNEAELKQIYKRHRSLIARMEQSASAAMQRSLVSKGALAIIYGRSLRYFIRKSELSIGRMTQENTVDVDLGKEGRANKVSRRQATIKLKEDGLFYLENHGKRSISVNGYVVAQDQRICLASNCLIEIGGMQFIFEINKKSVKKHQDSNHS
eukprot:TRINITY_DN5780_c0_g1_i3.p1 TRINITY_DN5780_c0_g1~~TRINITY_DN5780_c0_g1_i3.p1  ORF type:complete len:880 (+),score=211.04 TRINITY_DN5780_c0_g1_i3:584-3223(+)